MMHQMDVRDILDRVARDYEAIAEDLERVVEPVRHPELMPEAVE